MSIDPLTGTESPDRTASLDALFDIEWQLGETRDALERQADAAERQAAALEGLLALLTTHLTAAAPQHPTK